MTFEALHNRGDYFSPHYLDARLQQDLKDLRERWAEREAKGEATARTGLKALGRSFFAAKTTADGATSDEARHDATVAAHDHVLAALGFRPDRRTLSLTRGDDELLVPVAYVADTATGLQLVALDLHWAATVDDALDADGAGRLLAKLDGSAAPRRPKNPADAAEAISLIFATDDAPRFVLALAGGIVVLADRATWGEGRFLAADLDLALDRRDTKPKGELETLAALFSADALLPDGGAAPIEALTAGSQKHAVGVSKDLREGVRLSIELIANEVITRRLERNRRVYDEPDLARQLTGQALRYLYRIIVLLYAESRPEIGVLPTDHPEYGEGYGLDRLRSLLLTPVVGERARHGTHLYESLEVLFRLVNEGYQGGPRELALGDSADTEDIRFSALQSQLFAARSTQLIDEVKLGNACLQQVLGLLMLSKEQRGRERGFVSYAQLGINQIGAVYEGLMAYTGFFADEDLYEVSRPGKHDKGTWTLPVSGADGYADDVFVTRDDPATGQTLRVRHAKGTFVFRLSGRDRQRSASYYTPEVLTRCVVKHALAELLTDDTPAERILSMTVCEPALGSGAFLNEAINQLADEYLRRRQAERGETIDPDSYQRERQKVRAHLALHNAYGVDLNATAVELAEVSLWLNSLTPGVPAPWFGLHLRRGNSLIGARRATYRPEQLKKSAWKDTPPTDRPLSAPIEPGEIHHFLLPAHGWAAVADAAQAKELRPERSKALRDWRKAMLRPPTARDGRRLQVVAEQVELLWQRATAFVELADRGLRRWLDVWAAEPDASATPASRQQVDAGLHDPDSPLGRVRLVMDAWCALWFWPIDGAEPPSPGEWIATLEALLVPLTVGVPDHAGQMDLFAPPDTLDELLADELARSGRDLRPVAAVADEHPWLTEVRAIAEREGFHHWELEFAPVFRRGGFDLQVGNPPWVRPVWEDDVTLAELDPWFGVHESPPVAQFRAHRERALATDGASVSYLVEVAAAAGTTALLGSQIEHPVLTGVQINLYQLFMERAWRNQATAGVSGMLHPEGHFTDPKAGSLRETTYRRLRRHWQFANGLFLFDEIHDMNVFGVHIYGAPTSISFVQAARLQDPATIDASLEHDGSGEAPGIQYPGGGWDLRPHRDRVLTIDVEVLASWAALFDEPGTPAEQARLLRPVTVADLGALDVLARQPVRLADHAYHWSAGFHEKSAKENGTIEWRTEVPASWDDVVLQGPHFSVATPFNKQPNENCQHNQDYTSWDLESLPQQVIPRTNYQRACDPSTYAATIDQWNGKPSTTHWRVAWRRMTQPGLERSLQAALLPPGPSHVNTVHSYALENASTVLLAGLGAALPFDYLLKVSGKADVQDELARRFPLPRELNSRREVTLRALRLNCLTADYAPLWEDLFDSEWALDEWAEPAITGWKLGDVGPSWTMATALRTDYDRRKALVELDALAALALGLSAEQLCAMYRSQFAVLRKYEFNMAFSANGRRIAKDHQVAGFHQQKGDWELAQQWFDDPDGVELPDRYRAPLWRPDREAEMTTAWHVFADRYGTPPPISPKES